MKLEYFSEVFSTQSVRASEPWCLMQRNGYIEVTLVITHSSWNLVERSDGVCGLVLTSVRNVNWTEHLSTIGMLSLGIILAQLVKQIL